MIRIHRHDDVTRYELIGWRNRSVGLTVSLFDVRGTWVDTGFPHVARQVCALAAERRPAGVMVTHWHEDHAGNIEPLARSGVAFVLPEVTRAIVSHPHRIGWYRRYTWGTPLVARSPLRAFVPDGLTLRAAPGHSVDHHVVWDETTGTLFAADLFLGVRVAVAHSYEEPRTIARTLRAVIGWSPARLFDAHRGLIPHAIAALTAKADWLEETIGRIDEMTSAGVSAEAIGRSVHPGWDRWGAISNGDYSRLNFVRAVQRSKVESTA